MNIKVFWLSLLIFLLAACDSQVPDNKVASLAGPAISRQHNPELIALGETVYRERCSRCHGMNGEGAPGWRQKGVDGFYPPPPLNGSGHAWHHSTALLKQMILEGSQPGQGKMPAWQGKLSGQEVDAVIAWFQSLWPDQVYAAWYEMQQRNAGLR